MKQHKKIWKINTKRSGKFYLYLDLNKKKLRPIHEIAQKIFRKFQNTLNFFV